jgi:hypothetical protein
MLMVRPTSSPPSFSQGSDVVFDLNGKTAQCQDHGFSSVSDLQQFAKLFATRLKVEGKKKDLVLGPWKHNDDLKDFLQLCIVNLADKVGEKVVWVRKWCG